MLRGLDPLLNADVLYLLRAMGHGDDIAIVDANYPAVAHGKRVVRLDGVGATRVLRAILSVMPIDTFVDEPIHRMQVVGAPDEMTPIMHEFQALVDEAPEDGVVIAGLERFAFYERVKDAFAIITTTEARLYGNLIIKKGVVRPEDWQDHWHDAR